MCLPALAFLAPAALQASSAAAVAGSAAASAAATAGTISAMGMAGTAISTIGMFQQMSAAKQAASYNAQVADAQAADAKHRGELESQKVRRDAAQLEGTQRATMAARGLDLSGGTTASILEQTNYFGQVDATTARNNAEKEAWAHRSRAAGFRSEASSISPMRSALSTALTSGGQVAQQWYSFGSPSFKTS